MRNLIAFVISALFVTSLFFNVFLSFNNKKQTKQITSYMQEISSLKKNLNLSDEENTGGSESRIDEVPNVEGEFVFPIHQDDFLYYTSPYGIRVSPFLNIEIKHNGVDIASTWRAQVVSVADGIVVDHYPVPGTPFPGGGKFKGHPIYGGMIKVDHGDFQSIYAHLSWSRVHTGQTVRKGETIGRVGGTGMSKGEHLHFEILVDGSPSNPLLYLPNVNKENN